MATYFEMKFIKVRVGRNFVSILGSPWVTYFEMKFMATYFGLKLPMTGWELILF